MPPSTFAGAWGCVAICILISCTLCGCISMQARSYFSRFPQDSVVLKCAVAFIWLCSMLHLTSECWVLHSITILGYDQPFYDVTIPVGISIAVVLGTTVQATGKGTYIFRMYRFGQNRYILGCCCVLVLLELGLGFVWAGRVAIGGTAQQIDAREQEIEWVITSVFTVGAFVDVFIVASVSYQLWRSRAGGLKRTKYLIDKIMQWTIQTGMLTSAMAITIVLMWNLKRDSLIWLGLSAIEPDCYAVCLLTLLNARRIHSSSDHLSLPMTALSTESGRTGASSDPSTAENTTVMVFDPRVPLHRDVGQPEFQNKLYEVKSSFPFGLRVG